VLFLIFQMTTPEQDPLFPHDIKLEDVREAIAGRTDFRECEYSDHVVFVYFLGMAKDIFPGQ
jgi:hypothetical protein